jgi:hypothetical protein
MFPIATSANATMAAQKKDEAREIDGGVHEKPYPQQI